ncbi:hypothetical protein AB0J80_28935 [Actinoplanes sp. NPDC049548]|uniref:hypothetical protein n=1 Tax=Actinoplanes sp. NPDC049548 TaxID=3155152 RepID=UPI003422460F
MRPFAVVAAVLILTAGCTDAEHDRPEWYDGQPPRPVTIDRVNGIKGPVGELISTGVRNADGAEYLVYGITGGGVRSPEDFGFALGVREPGDRVTEDASNTEGQGPPATPGFHLLQGQMDLVDGSVLPAYGYYVGHPARITVTEVGQVVDARLARWSHDPGVTVFWFDPAQVRDATQWTDLAAYDRAGRRLPGGGPAGARDPFPDVTRDGSATVLLLSFDPRARSAVVEPAVFLPGPDYCEAFGISPIDVRCAQEIAIEGDKTRVTLPLAAEPELRGVGDGDTECLGSMTGGATCAVTPAYIQDLAKADAAVSVTVRDGVLVRIAELYQP